MITHTTEYALRAVVYLAERGEACTTQSIAKATQIPAGYLSKVMQGLARAGLVSSQRGLHGGFVLVDEPENITMLAVVEAVEPIRRYAKCPVSKPRKTPCLLHKKLDEVAQCVVDVFGDTTIQDLIAESGRKGSLCIH